MRFNALLWRSRVWSGVCIALTFCPQPAHADSVVDFLAAGHVLLDTRYRYESVDQNGFSNNANANTVRERLGYQTAPISDLTALIDLQATQHLSNTFNDTINGRTSYPQIPDPEAFELNRLQLTYTGVPDLTATIGRQVINLGDQRFIGASAFRQNEQTFDAARLDYTGLAGFTATYVYIDRVNRVFGDRSAVGHFDGNIQLFNLGYDISGVGKFTAYSYLLDLDHNSLLSTATYGLQFVGTAPLIDELGLHYTAGYARQAPYAQNPENFGLDYWRLEGGFDYENWSLTAGSEVLDGNGIIGFSTPLATLHAFQGDADVFLTTPPQGIADRYAKLGYQTNFFLLDASRKLTLTTWYHSFDADQGSSTLGHEFDFDAAVEINKHWRLDAAYATYNGTAGFASRSKTWLSLTVSY